MKKRCIYCRETFENRRPEQFYCSKECYHAARAKESQIMGKKTCEFCSALFVPLEQSVRFCSAECEAAASAKAQILFMRNDPNIEIVEPSSGQEAEIERLLSEGYMYRPGTAKFKPRIVMYKPDDWRMRARNFAEWKKGNQQ